jgi:hypothetical protein
MKKSTWLAIGLLVFLGIVAMLVMQRPGEMSISGSDIQPLVEYDSTVIDRMVISSPSISVTLEKDGMTWKLVHPLVVPADEKSVGEAIRHGKSLRPKGVVSTKPEKQHLFHVDSLGTRVTLFEKGVQRTAFVVGKPGSTYGETYLRLAQSDTVYLVEGVLGSVFEKKVNDWRDKTIFRSLKESISEATFTYGDTTFTLAFRDSAWFIGKDPVDAGKIGYFLTSLSDFQTDEFVDSPPNSIPELTGNLEVQDRHLRFYYDAGVGKYYVQNSASPQWYLVNSWKVIQLLKRKSEFFGQSL